MEELLEWRISGDQPVDEELKERVIEKIEECALTVEDLKDYFLLFTQIANSSEDIQDEAEEFNCSFQVNIEGTPTCWFGVNEKKFEAGSGAIENPGVVLNMPEDVALGIFSGTVDPVAAYMCGDIDVDGLISDALRFKELVEMVQDEMD